MKCAEELRCAREPSTSCCRPRASSTWRTRPARSPSSAVCLRRGGTLLLSTHGVWIHHPDPHDYWRGTKEELRRLVESQGFTIERVHHQAELFLTGLLLASYPAAAATTATRPAVRRGGYVLVTAVNITGIVLESLAACANEQRAIAVKR
jgi:hypothetical protein